MYQDSPDVQSETQDRETKRVRVTPCTRRSWGLGGFSVVVVVSETEGVAEESRAPGD